MTDDPDKGDPDKGMCLETSGFLFSHRCDRFAVQMCMYCGKPLCESHGHPGAEGVACTTCVKQRPKDDPEAEKRDRPATDDDADDSDADSTSDDDTSTSDYDAPYFYGQRWYPGYGSSRRRSSYRASQSDDYPVAAGSENDPDDFTEGDAESLQNEGDGDFESEMGES
jgi:hypothetical protein